MNRAILSLAIPNIISNISVPLLSSVDTALMGHLSTIYLSALGVGGMVFMFLYSIFGFLRMGTTSFVAQAYGAKSWDSITYTLYRATILALGIGIFIIAFEYPILKLSAYFMNIDTTLYPYFQEYFSIRVYTAPAVMLLFVIMGFLFGMQNAKYPLFITLVINIVNLVVSIYFVKYLNMGVAGVAWGSLIAQYVGVAFAIYLLNRDYKRYLLKPTLDKILQRDKLLQFFQINRDIFIRTTILMFSLFFFYSQASKDGEATLSIMVLLLQFMIWFSFVVDGFANASESLVGSAFGAKDRANVEIAIRLSKVWGFGVGILFGSIYLLFFESILHIYSDDLVLIQNTLHFRYLVAIFPLISFLAFIYDGIFIALGAVKLMRNILFISATFYIFTLLLLQNFMQFRVALWVSFMLFFLFRSLFSWVAFCRYSLANQKSIIY